MRNTRQRMLKFIYPVFNKLSLYWGRNNGIFTGKTNAIMSFYNLYAQLNNGNRLEFSQWKGKKVLLVNTASMCGYTHQYAGLQQLYNKYHPQLAIIAFPSNNFGEQEKGSDQEIEFFCSTNYGIQFPLALKCDVIKTGQQHPVYQWLSHAQQNGWNDAAPSWNFCKYLVDESGQLTHFFEAAIEPTSLALLSAIENKG